MLNWNLTGINCAATFRQQRCQSMLLNLRGRQCSKPLQTQQRDLGCCPKAYKEPQTPSTMPKIGLWGKERKQEKRKNRKPSGVLSHHIVQCFCSAPATLSSSSAPRPGFLYLSHFSVIYYRGTWYNSGRYICKWLCRHEWGNNELVAFDQEDKVCFLPKLLVVLPLIIT